LRAEVGLFIRRLGESYGWDELVRLFSPLLGQEIRVLLHVDASGTRVRTHALDSLPALLDDGDGDGLLVDLVANPDLTLKPGQTLRFTSTDLGRAAASGHPPLDVERLGAGEVPEGLMVLVRSPEVSG
jgi:hypothetical protein